MRKVVVVAGLLGLGAAFGRAFAAGAEATGSVEGRVSMLAPGPGGQQQIPQGWSLSGVVVYLVPEGGEEPPLGPPRRAVISQFNAAFVPPLLAVAKGDTVDFPNEDDADHNVFSFSKAKKFDLGIYPKGASKSVTFEREGPVLLFCSVHESMSGVIFVAPNRHFALTDRQGAFKLAGVPVGRYRLRTWHARLPAGVEFIEVQPLEVQKGEPTRVLVNLAAAPPGGGR